MVVKPYHFIQFQRIMSFHWSRAYNSVRFINQLLQNTTFENAEFAFLHIFQTTTGGKITLHTDLSPKTVDVYYATTVDGKR